MNSPKPVFPLVLALLVCATLVTACGRKPAEETRRLPFSHRFELDVGGQRINARIAIREDEQEQGLMWITSMPENEGMLFVSDNPRQMSFWMRNTRIPLDIGYFDSRGVLREVYPMYPGVEEPVESRSHQIRYALEMNQGWYRANGVTIGARLDLELVSAAVRGRGFHADYFVDRR